MNYVKTTLLCSLTLCLISCSTASKEASEKDHNAAQKYNSEFKKSLTFMENGQFSDAIQSFQSILDQQIPPGPFKWSVLFNIGSSYLRSEKCLSAKKTLQDLASQTNSKYKFRGQVLLQLHYTHECLGETHQALAVLANVEKESSGLSEKIRWIEIPSRYSILNASIGNKKQALFYQNKALEGLKKLKQPIRDKNILNQMASLNFYIMGRSFAHPSHIQTERLLNALPYHQLYLVQSFLVADSTWAPIVKKEIHKLYQTVFASYKKVPFNKKSLYKGPLMKSLNTFQKIANESQNKELKKISSLIIKQSQSIKK